MAHRVPFEISGISGIDEFCARCALAKQAKLVNFNCEVGEFGDLVRALAELELFFIDLQRFDPVVES